MKNPTFVIRGTHEDGSAMAVGPLFSMLEAKKELAYQRKEHKGWSLRIVPASQTLTV